MVVDISGRAGSCREAMVEVSPPRNGGGAGNAFEKRERPDLGVRRVGVSMINGQKKERLECCVRAKVARDYTLLADLCFYSFCPR